MLSPPTAGATWASLGLAAGLTLAVALTSGHARAQEDRIVAQQHFDAGMAAFTEGRFAAAAAAFRSSCDALASPNTRLMLARSLDREGHIGEAFAEIEFAVREASDRAARDPRFVQTRDAAEIERATLAERVGWLTLTFSPAQPEMAELDVMVDGRTFHANVQGIAIPVTPGQVPVIVQRGADRTERTVTVGVGERHEASFELTVLAPPGVVPPDEPRARAEPALAPWLIVALGAVGLGVATGVGIYAVDLHDRATRVDSMIDALGFQAQATDLALAANVTFVVAAVLFAIGTVWGTIDLANLASGPHE